MKNLLCLMFCSLLICVFASIAKAQTETVEFEKPFTSAKLSGIVVDQSDSPIANVLIERVGSDFKTRIDCVNTDSNGQFTFSSLGDGLYYLKFTFPNFNQLQVKVKIKRSSKSKLKFTLPVAT